MAHEVTSNETKMAINIINDRVDEIKVCLNNFVDKELFNLEMKNIQNKLDDILSQKTEIGTRVRSLELWRSLMAGGLGVILFFLPFIFYYLLK